MKVLLTVALVGLVGGAIAAPGDKTAGASADLTQRKAEFYSKTGGLVRKPGSEKGKIAIVNTQDRVADAEFEKVAKLLTDSLHLVFSVSHAPAATPRTAAAAVKAAGGDVGVVIAALSKDDPALMVFPDQRCALVNVAAFSDEFCAAAARKNVVRGFAAACGAMSSKVNLTLMSAFDNERQLAAFPQENVPVDVSLRVKNYLRERGVTPFVMTTYKHACREGWAHQPTNEVERIIWENMKAELNEQPSNPITIKPGQKPLRK